jgi:hypothetical protein
MKKQNLVPLLAMVLMLAVGAAYAQLPGATMVKVNIPFSFTANQVALPAGAYTVKNSLVDGVLLISSDDSSQRGFIKTISVESNRGADQTKLIFHRYGDQYFLSQVWVGGETSGRELPRTRAEKELMARGPFETVAILARK